MLTRLTRDQRYSFLAALLAWSMDTFDYFMLVLVLPDIARDPNFGASPTQLAFLTTATLVMRPFGAFLFGIWADRVGRRGPLIADVLLYSCTGILCAIAPNITVLLILRAIYGIGMGGEWGLGAALAMEKLPAARRGFFSGLLQEGYPIGYLMAALAYLMITALGVSWRWIFVLSIIPALTTLLLRRKVTESEAWQATQRNMGATRTTIRGIMRDGAVVKRFGYLIVLMTALNWMAHSAQDVYPTFLQSGQNGGAGLSSSAASWIIVCYTLGAIAGSVVFGALSERLGRRRTIVLAAGLGLAVIPLFIFPTNGVAFLVRRCHPHAVPGAGRLGCGPRSPDRDVPRRHPRLLPRRHLPDRQPVRRPEPPHPAAPGRRPRLPLRPRLDRRPRPARRRHRHLPRHRSQRRHLRRPHPQGPGRRRRPVTRVTCRH